MAYPQRDHYQTDGEIRMYGLAHDMDEDKTVVWDLYDQIVGWYEEDELVPGPHWTLIRRAKQEFAVEASITVWADHGHVLGGDFAGNKRILFAATHPDDLLHIQWTGERTFGWSRRSVCWRFAMIDLKLDKDSQKKIASFICTHQGLPWIP